MKILKILLGLVALLAVVLVAGGYLLSPKFSVTRSVLVNAPADKVYALIASPRQWPSWSVWNQRDPAMTIDYSGPEAGAGAAWAWKSRSEGDGKMRFTAAEPNQRVVYSLVFPDFENPSTGELRLAGEGGATRVTWVMSGDTGGNPLYRWFALGADRLIGKDFEAGLANLKALAEKP